MRTVHTGGHTEYAPVDHVIQSGVAHSEHSAGRWGLIRRAREEILLGTQRIGGSTIANAKR